MAAGGHPIRIALALALAALAIAALAAPAGATRHVHIASVVTLSDRNPFHGKVNSKPFDHACRPQRKVLLFKAKAVASGPIAKTRTDGKGRWRIPAGSRHGKFLARVRRQVQGTAGTIYTCRHDTSPIVKL
jgi:hypothetical protein